jgi:hypothetical protein
MLTQPSLPLITFSRAERTHTIGAGVGPPSESDVVDGGSSEGRRSSDGGLTVICETSAPSPLCRLDLLRWRRFRTFHREIGDRIGAGANGAVFAAELRGAHGVVQVCAKVGRPRSTSCGPQSWSFA